MLEIRKVLASVLALSLLLPAAGQAGIDPEAYGSRSCHNAVRNAFSGCDTYGLTGDQVIQTLGVSQVEHCRNECDSCCDTLPQYGDTTATLQSMGEFCGCAENAFSPEHAGRCLQDTLEDNTEFLLFLTGLGFMDGNVYEFAKGGGSSPIWYDGAGSGSARYDGSWAHAKDFDIPVDPGPGIFARAWQAFLVATALYLAGRACESATEWTVSRLQASCADTCQATYPTQSEAPNPPNPPGGGGGNNGDGEGPWGGGNDEDEGPGFPPDPCIEMEGQACFDDLGFPGYYDRNCTCVPSGTVETGGGCWPGEPCPEMTQACRSCLNDPDPPPWCDEVCWGF